MYKLVLNEGQLHEKIIRPYQIRYKNEIEARKKNLVFKAPTLRASCSVLQDEEEYKEAVEEAQSLGLPLYPMGCIQKNWDNLAALYFLLKYTTHNASILDAGGHYYSTILPWLDLYGYHRLICLNLTFKKEAKIGNIVYKPGDLTKTGFADGSFDAITCISVIEHGIDVEKYFKEMSRLLKPNGILFTSADYWPEPLDTGGSTAFSAPLNIFNRGNLLQAIEAAKSHNLELLNPIQLEAQDKVVQWKNLKYTFIYFTLKKLGTFNEHGSIQQI